MGSLISVGLMADVTSANYNAICNIYDGDF